MIYISIHWTYNKSIYICITYLLFGRDDGCLCVKELPGEYSIKYARWANRKMYLVSHWDKVHGECQYILAHYQVEHCTQPEESSSNSEAESKEIQLQFKDKHHEVEVCPDSWVWCMSACMHACTFDIVRCTWDSHVAYVAHNTCMQQASERKAILCLSCR